MCAISSTGVMLAKDGGVTNTGQRHPPPPQCPEQRQQQQQQQQQPARFHRRRRMTPRDRYQMEELRAIRDRRKLLVVRKQKRVELAKKQLTRKIFFENLCRKNTLIRCAVFLTELKASLAVTVARWISGQARVKLGSGRPLCPAKVSWRYIRSWDKPKRITRIH